MFKEEPKVSKNKSERRTERFFTTFKTAMQSVPYVEVTVIAGSTMEAKQIAREFMAPLKLSRMEID